MHRFWVSTDAMHYSHFNCIVNEVVEADWALGYTGWGMIWECVLKGKFRLRSLVMRDTLTSYGLTGDAPALEKVALRNCFFKSASLSSSC